MMSDDDYDFDKYRAEAEKERKEMIDGLKKADTLSKIVNAIRSGYLGEFRYGFYLTHNEAAKLIRKYIKNNYEASNA
jgi:hypothetical protein